jgi:fructose-1,6-bisphosphatase/inositol monophosphatase family enzyme
MAPLPDINAVTHAVRDAALNEALPKFHSLAAHEVSEKAPNDLLTIADLATERALSEKLRQLLPGSIVVGEEAVSENPNLIKALSSDSYCWLVDPIDGTINFANGLPLFATMVALVHNARVLAAWIYDPVHDVMAVAERGSGTYLNDQRVRITPPQEPNRYSGCLHLKGYDPELAVTAVRNFEKFGPLLVLHCAGQEYIAALKGRIHFAFYSRTNPWDHAPGELILAEAGGFSQHLDRSDYSVLQTWADWPLLVSAGEDIWHDLRRNLFKIRD